jgi:hypothetical protein
VYKRRLQGLRTIEGPKFNRLQWGVFILKIILKEPEMHVINDMNHRFDADSSLVADFMQDAN